MHPGGFVGGPAGRRRGFAAPSWPRSSPAWGPAPCSGGGPQTLHCVRACAGGRSRPRCRALGRWGPAPPAFYRHFAPGGALGPLGRWGPGFRRGLGRARPLRRGGPAPPMACPCVPVSAALRASSRGIGRPCLLRPCRPAFAAGPRAPPSAVGGARGPAWGPPRPAGARLRSTGGGRARAAARALGRVAPPAGVTGLSGRVPLRRSALLFCRSCRNGRGWCRARRPLGRAASVYRMC